MTTEGKKIDWSEKRWKQMLIDQRKLMWYDDTLHLLAAWMGIRPGMTAVDVGCGLGYLGYTYWPFFGKGGRYFGVDRTRDLVTDASTAAKEWAVGGEACFINGDADQVVGSSRRGVPGGRRFGGRVCTL